MGYKVTCSLSVEKGVFLKKGDAYSGPEDLVDQLLAQGLIEKDDSVKVSPKENIVDFGDIEEVKPVKKSKKGK